MHPRRKTERAAKGAPQSTAEYASTKWDPGINQPHSSSSADRQSNTETGSQYRLLLEGRTRAEARAEVPEGHQLFVRYKEVAATAKVH